MKHFKCGGGTSTVYVDDPPLKLAAGATVTTANKLLQFYTLITFSNNLAFSMIISGQYEVA